MSVVQQSSTNLRGESIPGELLVLWCGRGVEGVGRVRRHRRRGSLSMLVGVQVLLVVPEPNEVVIKYE